jgi:hypothetical protein
VVPTRTELYPLARRSPSGEDGRMDGSEVLRRPTDAGCWHCAPLAAWDGVNPRGKA